MTQHSSIVVTLSVAFVLFGCATDSKNSQDDAQAVPPWRLPSAGSHAGDFQPGGQDLGDAAAPMGMRDASTAAAGAGVLDAASAAASDAGAARDADVPMPPASDIDEADAGVVGAPPATDSGARPPRTDGCPADAPLPLDRVRVRAAAGEAAELVGARIQGSNSGPTTDFVDLGTVMQPPADGAFVELTFPNTQLYRYLRYYAPPRSQGAVAEVELYHGLTRLAGVAFGTVGANQELAFDGDATTAASLAAGGGGYVGLDIARGFVTEPVSFSPENTTSTGAVDVTLSTATEGAVIRYTTDGSDPSSASGVTYAAPIRAANGQTAIRAVASSSCRFDSAIRTVTYTVARSPSPVREGLTSYHVGNSLTDTINPWLEPIADSTGVDHTYARWTIPGAPIGWLAEHQGEGFEDPAGAASFDSFVQSFAPIDHLSLQPFSDPDFESQGGAAVGLLTTALQYSPNIQFWIYAQWPGRTEWNRDAFANGGGTVYPDWQVPTAPTNWEEATRNEVLYHEAFAKYVDDRVGGKPFLIVPGGLALVELKRQMDAGEIPGLSDFFNTMFEDEIHLTRQAQYLVALVFYACLYRQSPEGIATYEGTDLTEAQARAFQRIAWNVASAYPGSGILQ